jgi:hypothetical protein
MRQTVTVHPKTSYQNAGYFLNACMSNLLSVILAPKNRSRCAPNLWQKVWACADNGKTISLFFLVDHDHGAVDQGRMYYPVCHESRIIQSGMVVGHPLLPKSHYKKRSVGSFTLGCSPTSFCGISDCGHRTPPGSENRAKNRLPETHLQLLQGQARRLDTVTGCWHSRQVACPLSSIGTGRQSLSTGRTYWKP